MLTFVPIQRTLADADFSLTSSKGNSLIKQPTQQQKVGNYTMCFAFCIRIDEGSNSMSEKVCTKGKRKLHSRNKQIIMVLKALPYGLNTQALLRPQVCLCLSRISSPQSAASAFSTPALTQIFPTCNFSKSKNTQNWATCSSINQYTIVNWNYFHLGASKTSYASNFMREYGLTLAQSSFGY